MGFHKPKGAQPQEPSGFTLRSSGPASERARQQGWQTNQEERSREPEGKANSDGGTDYDYGAQDFGDLPADTSPARPLTPSPNQGGVKHKRKSAADKKKAA